MPQVPKDIGWGGAHVDQLRDLLAAAVDDITSLKAQVDELQTKFNAHTHNADGAQAGAYYTSPPRSDAATVTLGTAGTSTVSSTQTLTK